MNKLTYIIISIFALLFVGCDNEGDKLAEITGQAVSLSISSTDTNVQIEELLFSRLQADNPVLQWKPISEFGLLTILGISG